MNNVEKIAIKFSELLLAEIGEKNMLTVIKDNITKKMPGICHSHDFCDSNMVMYEAFNIIMDHEHSIESDADCKLWNAAWDLAYERNFFITTWYANPLPSFIPCPTIPKKEKIITSQALDISLESIHGIKMLMHTGRKLSKEDAMVISDIFSTCQWILAEFQSQNEEK